MITKNFYYRSSPYNGTDFIGKRSASSTLGSQNYNLNNPTTILNLGPRSSYLDELVLSNQFDGYVVDKIKESTYSSVLNDEYLNNIVEHVIIKCLSLNSI